MTEPLWEDEDRPRVAAMGPVKVRVPAKINLHLGVGSVRPDGFHELATVYHAIGIFDEVTARPADSLALTMDGEGAGEPGDQRRCGEHGAAGHDECEWPGSAMQ